MREVKLIQTHLNLHLMVRIEALAVVTALMAEAAFAGGLMNRVNINDLILRSDNSESIAVVGDQWFQGQLLDHNDPSNKKIWKQRYHVNTQWFGRGNSFRLHQRRKC